MRDSETGKVETFTPLIRNSNPFLCIIRESFVNRGRGEVRVKEEEVRREGFMGSTMSGDENDSRTPYMSQSLYPDSKQIQRVESLAYGLQVSTPR